MNMTPAGIHMIRAPNSRRNFIADLHIVFVSRVLLLQAREAQVSRVPPACGRHGQERPLHCLSYNTGER